MYICHSRFEFGTYLRDLAPSGLSEYRGGLVAPLAALAVEDEAVWAASSRIALGLDMVYDIGMKVLPEFKCTKTRKSNSGTTCDFQYRYHDWTFLILHLPAGHLDTSTSI
jgi:hypothetical protein